MGRPEWTFGEVSQRVLALAEQNYDGVTTHENGFFQLPLYDPQNARRPIRLHCWPDGPIARQSTSSPVHDHRFSFYSQILLGTLDHIEYRYDDRIRFEPPYRRYRVDLAGLVPEECGTLEVTVHFVLKAPSVYYFGARVFHETRPRGLTLTAMRKLDELGGPPSVIAPLEEKPAAFDRTSNDPVLIWMYYIRAIQDAREAGWSDAHSLFSPAFEPAR
jgi:hypothetical protein